MLLGSRNVSDMCLKIYFSDDHSVAEYIILNAVLYFLVVLSPASDKPQDKFSEARYLYAENLKSALASLPLYIKPMKDMVLALVLGVRHKLSLASFSVETSKPHEAWVLITAAYQAAQALGYHSRHRAVSEDSSELNDSGVIFWVIYYLEKSLSLRLGRCSMIQRYDISLPLPGDSQTSPTVMVKYCKISIQLADISSRVYNSLYSPQSLSGTDQVRTSKALELHEELKSIKRERESMKASKQNNSLDQFQLSPLAKMHTSTPKLWT
ncbi:unnamed protein product [Clonostachys rosea]|uniref:Xylanolytic transcriptional activator regulatory domain-containing protein n=1 Tax=Bionectria ochroleuca TaxID=29856 RepID=A0ABY6U769_BIOOC|nr:unnamed protein product [Clonostachys rosea]